MRKLLFKNALQLPVTEPAPPPAEEALHELAAKVDAAAQKRLGRSLSIREVDAGSCNGCELEIHALNNAVYDLERFGIRFVASPRHADVLLITGPVTVHMREPLLAAFASMPEPRLVAALGDCALGCGVLGSRAALAGSVEDLLPVDIRIPGCPPAPEAIARELLAALDAGAQVRG
jgi:Ni,Fe-hydrogenase III small subunit